MKNESNFLDRNEFNFQPSEEVVEALKNFDVKNFAFIPVSMTKGKKVYYPFSYQNFII